MIQLAARMGQRVGARLVYYPKEHGFDGAGGLPARLPLMVGAQEHLDEAGSETVIAEDHLHNLLAFFFTEQAEASVFLRIFPVVDGLGYFDVIDAESVPVSN